MPSFQWPITGINYDRVVARILIKLCTQYHLVTLWKGDLSRLRYTSYHYVMWKEHSMTLRNHSTQPYRALDTLFSEYYLLLLTLSLLFYA